MTRQEEKPIEGTRLVPGFSSTDVTLRAGAPVDQASLKKAVQAVDFEWSPGDVILDLYEPPTQKNWA